MPAHDPDLMTRHGGPAGLDVMTSGKPIDPAAVADYVYDMSIQLANMADSAGLNLLAYLLEMVGIEADVARKRVPPNRLPPKP